MNTIRNLYRIKERYFRPVIAHPNGLLCHTADCAVHRPIEIYRYAPCTCGLNYDLHWLGHGLAEKLNPNFGNEYRLQEVGVSYAGKVPQEEVDKLFEAFLEKTKSTEISVKMINDTLAGISSPLRIPEPEEFDDSDEMDWLHIAVVFSDEYCDFLKSKIHNQKCPTCDWSWCGEVDQKCGFCKTGVGVTGSTSTTIAPDLPGVRGNGVHLGDLKCDAPNSRDCPTKPMNF